MQSAEIELKFPVASISHLEARLVELGFQLDTPRTFEQNTLYDTPARTLRARGEFLRLRRYGKRCLVTHKRHPENEELASLYKVRIETETEFDDEFAMVEILARLGFAPSFRYEKFRSEYSHPVERGAHLVLDETPIGVYAELEGPPAWIDRTLSELQIDPTTCLTESYGRLFMAWRERTGSSAQNLTFDDVAQGTMAAR